MSDQDVRRLLKDGWCLVTNAEHVVPAATLSHTPVPVDELILASKGSPDDFALKLMTYHWPMSVISVLLSFVTRGIMVKKLKAAVSI